MYEHVDYTTDTTIHGTIVYRTILYGIGTGIFLQK
jgi:hypothetical protein